MVYCSYNVADQSWDCSPKPGQITVFFENPGQQTNKRTCPGNGTYSNLTLEDVNAGFSKLLLDQQVPSIDNHSVNYCDMLCITGRLLCRV